MIINKEWLLKDMDNRGGICKYSYEFIAPAFHKIIDRKFLESQTETMNRIEKWAKENNIIWDFNPETYVYSFQKTTN